MDMSIFIKMARRSDALEQLVSAIESRGCEVVELTARSSLDRAKYFVRMELQGNGTLEGLPRALANMNGMEQVDVLPKSSVALPV